MQEQLGGLMQAIDVNMLVAWGLRLLGVFALLIGARIVAGGVRRGMRRAFERANFDVTLGLFFANLAYWSLLIVAVLLALGLFGIETTSFAAILAAAGFAVGMAFQGTLSNFASGVLLLVFRPFAVGDFVRVAGEAGTVDAIDLFTTTLDTPDRRRIIIPNSAITSDTIENVTHHDTRRVDVEIGVAYDAGTDATRRVFEQVARSTEGVLADPEPVVMLNNLGASSVDWVVRAWCRTEDYWTVRERLLEESKKALDAAGIGIPFPQLDVHLDQPVSG
ncbi:MAG: hypothetical protein Kow0062_21400 [Acidobacteriota bacterium]